MLLLASIPVREYVREPQYHGSFSKKTDLRLEGRVFYTGSIAA